MDVFEILTVLNNKNIFMKAGKPGDTAEIYN